MSTSKKKRIGIKKENYYSESWRLLHNICLECGMDPQASGDAQTLMWNFIIAASAATSPSKSKSGKASNSKLMPVRINDDVNYRYDLWKDLVKLCCSCGMRKPVRVNERKAVHQYVRKIGAIGAAARLAKQCGSVSTKEVMADVVTHIYAMSPMDFAKLATQLLHRYYLPGRTKDRVFIN